MTGYTVKAARKPRNFPVQEEKRIKYIRRCVSKNAAIYPFIRDIKDIRIFSPLLFRRLSPRNILYYNKL